MKFMEGSATVANAHSLVGKTPLEMRELMGIPSSHHSSQQFNRTIREAMIESCTPKDVPVAAGFVFGYELPFTRVILLYAKGGVIDQVYICNT